MMMDFNDNREIVHTNVQTIQEATKMAQRLQREEENTDERASRADRHSLYLKMGSEEAMTKIEAYQDNIDNYEGEIKEYKTSNVKDQERILRKEDITIIRLLFIVARHDADYL